ncbi:phosphoenolpyruvate synthase [Thalassolituus pacificus]|uniref:Phosphoenolpyruvate synthase n=1 Tax=Thalassolituus pacificus TaxID=2975440 RepID=A0A9X2WDB9_9GAMM|nr:phosphoenolpyruvate synthase [Thalassolituus pacificus]
MKKDTVNSPANYCLDALQAAVLSADQIGGKAFNLAFLSRQTLAINSLQVPQWWVVPVAAFRAQLRSLNLEQWIETELASLGDKPDSSALEQVARGIQQKIREGGLLIAIADDVRTAIGSEALAQGFWAVRSSVVGEDAEGASFAGQMDSCLYQRGEEQIAAAIITVMQSAFNARALAYRIQKGLGLTDINAAVIIQRMIDADVAGVMFTANPVNGDRGEAFISATWGCGEGLVSGHCNADEISVRLSSNELSVQVNDKDLCLVQDTEQGGTREQEVAADKRAVACLTDTQIFALRDLGRSIAEAYCAPQDIEWCLKDGAFYILQARPVTRLPEQNPDTDRLQVWDNSNIQESYCGVTTPLTFSFANRAYKTVYEQTLRLLGVRENVVQQHQDMLENMLGLIRGRVYYNINNWYRGLLFLPSFRTNKADMERMMGLTDPVDLIQDRELSGREKLARLPQMLRALFAMLSRFRRMDDLVAEFRAHFAAEYARVERNKLHSLSMDALISLSRTLDKTLLNNWTTPIVNDFYVMMMNGKVHRWLEKLGVENPALVQNNLLSGEEGIESTEPTKFLLRLCDEARTQPELLACLKDQPNDQLLVLLQLKFPDFHSRCLQYIELYGDRTMGELKLESVTLRQDASFMFAVLKNFLSRDDLTLATLAENEARFRAEAEQAVLPALQKQFGRRGLKKFQRDLSRLRDAIRNRENMRLARTRMFGLYRDIFRQLGEQLAFYSQLEQAEDIFYLTLEEIYAYADGRSVTADLKPLVAIRRAEFASYEADEPPHHFHTRGPLYCNNRFEYPHAQEETAAADGSLQGTGCYPGIVEQKVRLIFSPDDELNLNGQILCTVRTDPGWAPLFPTAGGILVERGSTLSHSAVVARELGIPAVVGIPGLTKLLADQELVRMDGSSGRVERLEFNAAESVAAAEESVA